jgi:hypothetical protein
MIQDVPFQKECPICKETKLAKDFYRDASRRDGLKFCCIGCSADYKPKKSRLDYTNYKKVCTVCERELEAKFFMHSHGADDDNLEKKCRTCRSWRKKGVKPSIEDVIGYESLLDSTIREAISILEERYEDSIEDLMLAHRSEFEQVVQVLLVSKNTVQDWKMPLWIHASSDPEFDGNK